MTATRRSVDGEGVFSGRLGFVWERLNSSFWFVPALIGYITLRSIDNILTILVIF